MKLFDDYELYALGEFRRKKSLAWQAWRSHLPEEK